MGQDSQKGNDRRLINPIRNDLNEYRQNIFVAVWPKQGLNVNPATRDVQFAESMEGIQLLCNIGGMSARAVDVAVLDSQGRRRLGNIRIPLLEPGEEKLVSIPLAHADPKPVVTILPGDGYTAMDPPNALEVLPRRQMRGGPVCVCWTARPDERIGPEDRLEFVDRSTGKVVHVLRNDGGWKLLASNLYLGNIDTAGFQPGQYAVSLIDGSTEGVKASDTLTVTTETQGRFFVGKLNGRTWTGDPQKIAITAGDTFEVSWDFGDARIPSPSIYISSPGDPLRLPFEGSYACVSLSQLSFLIKDPAGDPLSKGSWTWKSRLEEKDLSSIPQYRYSGGWIRFGKNPQDSQDPRISMSRNPGTWRLWIGTEHEYGGWAVPATPAIAIEVQAKATSK